MNQSLLAFNAGEVSPYMRHRIDFDRTASSAEEMTNFLAMPYGAAVKRPGLEYLAPVETAGPNSRTFPFIASDGSRYLLHFTADTLTVYDTAGTEKASLAFLADYAWPDPFDWNTSLRTVQIVQLNDIAYIAHQACHPMQLSRLSDSSWTLEYIAFPAPPMLDENTDTGLTYSVAANPPADAWTTATAYTAGDEVTTNSQWVCIANHTSGTTNKPGTGSAWRTYWSRRIFAAGDAIALIADDASGTGWTLNYHTYHAGDLYTAPGTGELGIALVDHTSDLGFNPEDAPTSSEWGLVGEWSDDFIVAAPTVALGAYRTNAADPTLYQCILAHAPYSIGSTSEPGVGATWETYWEDTGITLPGTLTTWFLSDPYAPDTVVTVAGRRYKCTTSHTPVEVTNKPGSGSGWSSVWQRLDAFPASPSTLTGRGPGRYYRIAPERTAGDYQIELLATNGAISPSLFVAGEWDFFTYGTWTGTFYVERSYDQGATWTVARYYQTSADRNVADQGTEDPAALLRVRFSGTTGSGEAVLIPRSADVPGFIVCDERSSESLLYGTALSPVMSGSTYRWTPGAFSDVYGYPRAIALHDASLCFAGTTSHPVSLWLSQADDFTNFETGANASDSIFATLALTNASPIRWLASQRRLIVGTAFGEWIVGSETSDAPTTPTNFMARQHSSYGTAAIPPLIANDALFFTERNGSRLREFGFSSERGTYDAQDLSRIAEHLTAPGLSSFAWQQTREPGLWIVRRDGILLHFAYARAERLAAWSKHTTTDGLFRDVVVFPSDAGDDEVFFIIDRGDVSTLERFPQHWQAAQESGTGWFALDGIRGTGDTLALPDHLDGAETVSILNGTDDDIPATPADDDTWQIGLPIVSRLTSLPIDSMAGDGSTQARKKRMSKVILSLFASRGGSVTNRNDARTQPIANTQPSATLRTGWEETIPDAGGLDDMQLRILHSDPFPFTIRAAVIRWQLLEPG